MEEKAKALTKIPISNDTVKRLRDNDFAIQLDESIDVSQMSRLRRTYAMSARKRYGRSFYFTKSLG